MGLRSWAMVWALGAALGTSVTAQAQDFGCDAREVDDPPRQVLHCPGGLVLDVEAAAAIGIRTDGSTVLEVMLERGGVRVELEPVTRFQILTPHAIASVRGTTFIVDAGEESTAVFVEDGVVDVRRRRLSDSVTLNAGEGVDVARGTALVGRQWPADRVTQTLSRFGR